MARRSEQHNGFLSTQRIPTNISEQFQSNPSFGTYNEIRLSTFRFRRGLEQLKPFLTEIDIA
jgi:hypothetical protein